ncbi:hypothetical protein, partial [Microbacterium sp. GbtcB4]|uniref:hypothetical protein n=1 Tax=Microbacterium sp. GbtcB4 TaxID=2824749 RepID=UPI001C30D713
RVPDAWVASPLRRQARAHQPDQPPPPHPIVAAIPHPEAAKLNFGGITYAKRASELNQLVAVVGDDGIYVEARRYFG